MAVDVAENSQYDDTNNARPEMQYEIQSNWDQVSDTFEAMNLREDLLRGIYAYGYERPSAIQSKAIIPMICGYDTIAQAQSGTGKTATFLIGALQNIELEKERCQALIISPTRELAQQTQKVALAIGDRMKIRCHACIGGTLVRDDIEKLKSGIHVVVGTPGRVLDMMSSNYLPPQHIKLFILDEADDLLSQGFKSQIYDIFKRLKTDVQVGLFSATIPRDILELSYKFMRDPKQILVKKTELSLEGITQYYVMCEDQLHKRDFIQELYESMRIQTSIIYCKSKRLVDSLSEYFIRKEYTISSIHGDMKSEEREFVLKEFRTGSSRMLISTDLMARGIDIQQLSLVINFDMPQNHEIYIHRIGRSGRFGRKGLAINLLVGNADLEILRGIERYYDVEIENLPFNLSADSKFN